MRAARSVDAAGGGSGRVDLSAKLHAVAPRTGDWVDGLGSECGGGVCWRRAVSCEESERGASRQGTHTDHRRP